MGAIKDLTIDNDQPIHFTHGGDEVLELPLVNWADSSEVKQVHENLEHKSEE